MSVESHGTLLKRAGATIAEVKDISGPNFSRGSIETTSHSSPGAWKEFILGTKENGEITFSVNFIPTDATHSATAGLLYDFINNVLGTYTLTFPDASVWTCTAYVMAFGVTAPVEGVLGANVTLKLSGAPSFA